MPGTIRAELDRIWCEVLRTEQVEDDDDFFDSGGDSLSAARMTSLGRRIGLPVGAADILRNPRFGDLVDVLQDELQRTTPPGAPPGALPGTAAGNPPHSSAGP